MILCLIYCKHNDIEFKLYSRDANFKIQKGWKDFFLPFCTESFNPIHSYINERQDKPNEELYITKKFWWFCWKYRKYVGTPFRIHILSFYKFLFFNVLLTYELWDNFRIMPYSNHLIKQEARKIISETYKFNNETQLLINEYENKIPFTDYVGLHIRGGDKITENKLFDTHEYMNLLKQNSSIKNVFVFTDDYRLFNKLINEYPDFFFYTIIDSADRGYSMDIMQESIDIKKDRMIKMFASIEIIGNANKIFCSLSSNPGMFLGMRFPEKTLFVDSNEWRII